MNISDFYFRVDASKSIGMGHARRCISVAKELLKIDEYKVFFLVSEIPRALEKELNELGVEVKINIHSLNELDFISNSIIDKDRSAIIFDSYKFEFYTEKFQKEIISHATKVTYIVFDNKPKYFVHILHNQNPLSLNIPFKAEKYTKKLFGLDYLILDEKFRDNCSEISTNETTINLSILLSFGGSDPHNLTCKVLNALYDINKEISRITIVLGSMFSNHKELNNIINKKPELEIITYQNTTEMPKLMKQSSVALISGGITTWELGALKVPSIILPQGEKEQKSAVNLQKLGWSQVIANPLEKSISELKDELNILLDNDLEQIANNLRNNLNINGVNNFIKTIIE